MRRTSKRGEASQHASWLANSSNDIEILPTPERLERCAVAGESGEDAERIPATPCPGHDGYLEHLFAAFENEHLTEGEWKVGFELHKAAIAAGLDTKHIPVRTRGDENGAT